jgi:tRNA pseudouridine55 synthase
VTRRSLTGDNDRFGVLLVDKPEGPTSHDIVGWIRWALDVPSVGHCGTLDPAASGLLVICVGAATRLVPYLTDQRKTYRARFALGRSTTTDDREGETLATAPISAELHAAAVAALPGLAGAHELPPPAFSAVKIAGQRAHRLARRGEDVELPPRPMTVLSVTDPGAGDGPEPWVEATLEVSKGTYIRSLALLLGQRLGVPAHLAGLRRLACGEASLDDPRTIAGIDAVREPPTRPGAAPRTRLSLPDPGDGDPRAVAGARLAAGLFDPTPLLSLPVVRTAADDPRLARLVQGQAADGPWPDVAQFVLRAPGRLVVAVRDGERARPERVLAVPNEA